MFEVPCQYISVNRTIDLSLFDVVNVTEQYVGCFSPVHCRERILVINLLSRTVGCVDS